MSKILSIAEAAKHPGGIRYLTRGQVPSFSSLFLHEEREKTKGFILQDVLYL